MNTDPAQIQSLVDMPVNAPVHPIPPAPSGLPPVSQPAPMSVSVGKEGMVVLTESQTPETKVPEKTAENVSLSPESSKLQETMTMVEKAAEMPAPITVSSDESKPDAGVTPPVSTIAATPGPIVDKTTNIVKTHNVAANADKITTLADEEEEEFIKEVEDHAYDRK